MGPRRYRILNYPWHTGQDYELVKLPHDFFFLSSTPRRWATVHRPVPPQIRWVPAHTSEETDVMILHLDQWSHDEISKRALFLKYKALYSGPKIVVNHGCNMVDGCSSETMRELVEGCLMVCNSCTAQDLWAVQPSVFIRHGMSPEEWPSTDYRNHNIVVTQPFGRHPEVRNFEGIKRAERRLPITAIGRDRKFSCFDDYRRFLQTSSIFLQPSYASANPRARTEAMLSGLAIVTTASQGEEEYIKNGENGFCSNDFDELIDFLNYLYKNPARAQQIGQEGRRFAHNFFHIDRYLEQWNSLLNDYVG